MEKFLIKNFEELAITENRRLALLVAEKGLRAINTEEVILNSVCLDGENLMVNEESFLLSKFKNIKVVGFGKASVAAASALEKVLGSRIKEGAIIGLQKGDCRYIETFVGTHPKPSLENIKAGEKIYEILKNATEADLIIALVSGGGSALLSSSEKECEQGIRLYESFLKTGKTIGELNTIRKHLSVLKGGGLAKAAYPATVLGLIFSDVPGNNFSNVASGPTYKDETTVADAQKIIAENNLGDFDLIETPKEDKYFEKVHNVVLVSNKTAAEAMARAAESLGFVAEIISTELYDEMGMALEKIFSAEKDNAVIIAAGEPSIKVAKNSGKGGRNTHMALMALHNGKIDDNSVFIALASDGLDNSDAAGAIVDKSTLQKMKELDLGSENYLNGFNSYPFFQKTGDRIMAGPTAANVSDLMILLTKK